MHALKPRAIRELAGVDERSAAKRAHVSRGTLRMYEANPESVKTPAKRWLCQEFYAGLEREMAGEQARWRMVVDGLFDEAAESGTDVEADGPATLPSLRAA